MSFSFEGCSNPPTIDSVYQKSPSPSNREAMADHTLANVLVSGMQPESRQGHPQNVFGASNLSTAPAPPSRFNGFDANPISLYKDSQTLPMPVPSMAFPQHGFQNLSAGQHPSQLHDQQQFLGACNGVTNPDFSTQGGIGLAGPSAIPQNRMLNLPRRRLPPPEQLLPPQLCNTPASQFAELMRHSDQLQGTPGGMVAGDGVISSMSREPALTPLLPSMPNVTRSHFPVQSNVDERKPPGLGGEAFSNFYATPSANGMDIADPCLERPLLSDLTPVEEFDGYQLV